jgi:multicomponent Na+:H+ antiporter subunit E
MKNLSSFLFLWPILMATWIILNDSLHIQVVVAGVVASGIIALLFASRATVFLNIRLHPKALIYGIAFIFVFLWALIKSNIDVALRVIAPRIRINPGIVEIKTNLKTPIGRMALANFITLTPGTLTVEIDEDTFYIHWIDVTATDVEGATREIASTFEKYLEVIYG